MRPAIKSAIEQLEAATLHLRATLANEQPKCDHPRVIHSNWRSSEWGSAFKARRLCLECGLEEQALHSGWGDNDRDFTWLKTGGFHKVVNSDELYRARFPEVAVDANEVRAAVGGPTK